MILDDLNSYYELKVQEEDSELPRLHWSREKVVWQFRLDEDGRLVTVVPYANVEKKIRHKMLFVPEHAARTVGVKPFFLCDKAAYVLGRDEKRGDETLEASRRLHHEVLDGVDDIGARAILAFLDTLSGIEIITDAELEALDEGGLIVFAYIPDESLIHTRKEVIDAWIAYCDRKHGEDRIQCAVTGKQDFPADLFPMLRGFPGGQSSGASLISFNKDSFCSYGKSHKDQALNASISETAAFNIGSALRYLTQDRNHRLPFGDSQLLFWTEKDEVDDDNAFRLLIDCDSELNRVRENEALLSDLKRKLEDIRAGKRTMNFDRSSRYFLLGLAPNAARLSVRLFESGTLGELETNLQKFLRDTEMVAGNGRGILPARSIRYYAYQTAALGKAENVPETLISTLTDAVLKGYSFPESFFQLLISRTRIDKGYSGSGDRKYDAMGYRAAAMKACLLRKRYVQEGGIDVSLNKEKRNIGYLLGRLFAVLEKVQKDAIPSANATIRDRYMGAASATPRRVFPQLLKMSQHHIAKVDTGFGIAADKRIQEIVEGVGEFPATLSYDDQGQFYIGYYHQKAEIYKSKDAHEAPSAESEE